MEKEPTVMVKYGVFEEEIDMEKTAGRGEDKVSVSIPDEEVVVTASDESLVPPWAKKKEDKLDK